MTLSIELCFRPDADGEVWSRTLDGVFGWRPALAPCELKRLSNPDAPRREPWTEDRRPELARRLADEATFAWTVVCAHASVLFHREPTFVKVAAIIKASSEDAADELIDLIATLESVQRPALAMAFDTDSDRDRELTIEQLADIPPVLYVDHQIADRIGGIARLHTAPADVRDVLGGVLLVARDRDMLRAHLGISAASTLGI